MYDHHDALKFHLEDLERQARACMTPRKARDWSGANSPVFGMVAVAGIAGLVVSLIGA